MREKMNFYMRFALILYLFAVIQFSFGQAPPVVTVDFNTAGLTPGSTIEVPIKLTGTLVGSYSFIMNYDRDVLTLNSVQNISQISGNPVGIYQYNANYVINNLSYLKLTYGYSLTNGPSGWTYNNDVVWRCFFTFNGGTTDISFVNIATNTSQSGANYTFVKAVPYTQVNVSTTFTTGLVSGNYATLTSVSSGGDWNTPTTWLENGSTGQKTPNGAYNVIITSNPVTIAPTTNAAKCHDLTINTGGKLTLNSGKTLTTTGVFTINTDGSFIDQNTTSTLSATVKRSITGNYAGSGQANANTIWHYVSSPVSNGVIGTFMYCLLNKWTETTSRWDTLCLPVTLPLEIGRGYSVAATPYFGNAVFSGTLNTGDITRNNLTNSDPSYPTYINNYGYHLLGNPYPSAVKWDANISRTNVDAAIYLWNGSTYISKLPADNYEIQSIQGFFVHANANGGSVVLKNANRVHNSGSFLKNSVEDQLTLSVTGNNLSDETSVRFNSNATPGFDGEYDALKLFGIYSCPQIYSILPDLDLSINSLQDMNTQTNVAIGFKAGITGNFNLNVTGMESFTPGTEFYLTDLLTGSVQNLNSNPVYSFTAYPSDAEHRFNLHFASVGVGDLNPKKLVNVYSFEKEVYINVYDNLKGYALIYDLPGRQVARLNLEPNSLNKIGLDVPQGYYLVKVITDRLSVSEKVLVR